jgi:ubiquinone/menaquinone biosynthesis C-methylase UbiE
LRSRFEEEWRTRFEEFASVRDDDAGIAGWTATGLDARVRRFLKLWKPDESGPRWLDAGCGAGTYTRILRRQHREVVGVDYSLPTLRRAAARDKEGAVYAVADVTSLPFRGEQFDGVLCLGVTQALAAGEPVLRELARLLKPGGELWIDALNGACLVHVMGSLKRRLRHDPQHLRYEAPRRLLRSVRDSGFSDARLYWMPIMPARTRRLQRLVESESAAWVLRNLPWIGALVSHGFIVRARKPA